MRSVRRVGSRAPAVVVLACLSLLASGCGTSSRSDGGSGAVMVSAAASLTEAFTAARVAFESASPGSRITLNFGASSALASQIVDDAPVDVFASADTANMTKVADAGLLAGEPVVFATNSLRLIVPAGNPRNLSGVTDLATPGLVYVTCSPDVPIGRYAAQALTNAGVRVTPRSYETDVKGIVAKVAAGEADAGIVYATDATAAKGAVTGIALPESVNVLASYPIATLASSNDPVTARAWIDFLLSTEGRTILAAFGFGPP